jgi:hypothetical protein
MTPVTRTLTAATHMQLPITVGPRCRPTHSSDTGGLNIQTVSLGDYLRLRTDEGTLSGHRLSHRTCPLAALPDPAKFVSALTSRLLSAYSGAIDKPIEPASGVDSRGRG